MTPEEIPDELVQLLDDRAGKKHSRDGSVVTTLAEILTRWEQIRALEGERRRHAGQEEKHVRWGGETNVTRWIIALAVGAVAAGVLSYLWHRLGKRI